MIFLNNKALENVAPVLIEDIRVGPVIQTPVARDKPLNAGMTFIRAHEGTRTVGITFAIWEEDAEQRAQYLEAITAWALSEQPVPMQLPTHKGRHIYVMCTGLPEPSTRQWWEARLNLTFTAYDPFFYDDLEREEECGTAFTVKGNAPPKMRILTTLASAGNLTYSDGTNSMTFTSVSAGNIVIDLNKQTAKRGSTSIMDKFGLTSKFIIPRTGTMTITGTGTVKWREAWQA